MARTRGGRRRSARTGETSQSKTVVSITTANSQLPTEMISEILLRLPVKSLLRFKSLSRSLYDLIKSKYFVKQHLDYSRQNPHPVFSSILSIVSVQETDKQHFRFRVNLIDILDKPADLDLPFMSTEIWDAPPMILGIIDGLVCVEKIKYNEPNDIFICNPLTGDFRKLPPFRGAPNEELYGSHIYYGLGLIGDKGYELFRIFYMSFPNDDEDEDVDLLLVGEVYSFSTNIWRTLDVKMGDFDYLDDRYLTLCPLFYPAVSLHGVFYWEGLDTDSDGYVVCFNVENEVFDEFEAPEDCFRAKWMLRDLKDELAVVIYSEKTLAFDIWVLDETLRIWTKKLTMKDGYMLSIFPRNSIV